MAFADEHKEQWTPCMDTSATQGVGVTTTPMMVPRILEDREII